MTCLILVYRFIVHAVEPVQFVRVVVSVAAGMAFLTFITVNEIERLNATGMAVTRLIERGIALKVERSDVDY